MNIHDFRQENYAKQPGLLHLSTIRSSSLQQSDIFQSGGRNSTQNTNILAFLWSFCGRNFGSVFTTFSRHFDFQPRTQSKYQPRGLLGNSPKKTQTCRSSEADKILDTGRLGSEFPKRLFEISLKNARKSLQNPKRCTKVAPKDTKRCFLLKKCLHLR